MLGSTLPAALLRLPKLLEQLEELQAVLPLPHRAVSAARRLFHVHAHRQLSHPASGAWLVREGQRCQHRRDAVHIAVVHAVVLHGVQQMGAPQPSAMPSCAAVAQRVAWSGCRARMHLVDDAARILIVAAVVPARLIRASLPCTASIASQRRSLRLLPRRARLGMIDVLVLVLVVLWQLRRALAAQLLYSPSAPRLLQSPARTSRSG